MDRRRMIEYRLEQILTLWLQAGPEERAALLMERIRLQAELEELRNEGTRTA